MNRDDEHMRSTTLEDWILSLMRVYGVEVLRAKFSAAHARLKAERVAEEKKDDEGEKK